MRIFRVQCTPTLESGRVLNKINLYIYLNVAAYDGIDGEITNKVRKIILNRNKNIHWKSIYINEIELLGTLHGDNTGVSTDGNE